MNRPVLSGFLIVFVIGAMFAVGKADGQDSMAAPSYKEGDFWVYRIIKTNKSMSRSDDINGTYTITFTAGKFSVDYDSLQNFSDTIPTVPLAKDPPWYQFPLSPKKTWEFEYNSDVSRTRWRSKFTVENSAEIAVPAGSFTATKLVREDQAGNGWKTFTYYYSVKAKSAVKAEIEYKTGTKYNVELVEYGNKGAR